MRRVLSGAAVAAAVMFSAGLTGVGLSNAAMVDTVDAEVATPDVSVVLDEPTSATDTASAASAAAPTAAAAPGIKLSQLQALDQCSYPDDCEPQEDPPDDDTPKTIECDVEASIFLSASSDQVTVAGIVDVQQECPDYFTAQGAAPVMTVELGGTQATVRFQTGPTAADLLMSEDEALALVGQQGTITTTVTTDDCIVVLTVSGEIDMGSGL